MRIMHVDASPKRVGSTSKLLSAYFIAQLQKGMTDLEVDYIDTSTQTPPHLTHDFIEAMYTPATLRSRAMQATLSYSDNLCARLLMSDMLVFAMPMYNFSMPSSFKALIDNLVRPDLTFCINKDGSTSGKLTHQRILFITTRGADFRVGISPWSGMDALTPALKSSFSFMGGDAPIFVDVQPLDNHNPIERHEVLAQAYLKLDAIALQWIANFRYMLSA